MLSRPRRTQGHVMRPPWPAVSSETLITKDNYGPATTRLQWEGRGGGRHHQVVGN